MQIYGFALLIINFYIFLLFQHLYPKSQIDVYVTILEDDGCTLACALTVAGLALADAGIQMFDLLVGASLVSYTGCLFKSEKDTGCLFEKRVIS